MKRASVPLAVLACAALLACHAGVGGHLSEADKDKIRKVVDEGMRTVNPPTSDVEAYVKLYYAEDARALPPNHATVTGREAIGTFLRSAGTFQAVQFTILAVEGRNDLAYVHGGYQLSVTPPGAAEAVGLAGPHPASPRLTRAATPLGRPGRPAVGTTKLPPVEGRPDPA
jgi:ketosteroid isomerase-like protein